jgi:2-keto-4-pentenoate hydratase
MGSVDPNLAGALAVQLEAWRATLAAGAERVGWKLGVGDAERIGRGPVIGHLTTATELDAGSVYDPGGDVALHADAEVALTLGRDVEPGCDPARAREAIAGFGAALELVDLGAVADDAQRIVAANVFHRAFTLGPMHGALPPGVIEGRLTVNGEVRASDTSSRDFAEAVQSVAALLGAMGERLRVGDHLITGSVVQVPINHGDDVIASLGPLGQVALTIAA